MTDMKFEDVVGLWQADKKRYVKRSTYYAYSLLITNHLLPAFSGMTDVTETVVQEFVLEKLRQGLSRKSVKDILIVLKMILRYAAKNGYMSHHEIDVKYPIERQVQHIDVLSLGDQRFLIDYIENHLTFMNLGIYICLCTGLRIGEICALVWDDIDMKAGVVNVSRTIQRIYMVDGTRRRSEVVIGTPKSVNSIRQIPLSRNLQKILRPLKKIVNGSFYVLTNSARPIEPRSYRNHFNRLIGELDIPKLKFHSLRHSFATRCIESRCDTKTVSLLLGHSSVNTTLNLYVHPNMDHKKKCIEQMSRILK